MFNSNTYFGTDGTLAMSNVDGFDKSGDYLGDDGLVGRVTNVTLQVRTAVKAFHDLGSRSPRELRAGNISISGTVERAYINGALIKLMLGQYAEVEESLSFKIPTFNMKLIMD